MKKSRISITVIPLSRSGVCGFCKQFKPLFRVIFRSGVMGTANERHLACQTCIDDLQRKANAKTP